MTQNIAPEQRRSRWAQERRMAPRERPTRREARGEFGARAEPLAQPPARPTIDSQASWNIRSAPHADDATQASIRSWPSVTPLPL